MLEGLAVARYTLIELTRRRLLGVIVAIGVVLTAGIAVAPHVLRQPTPKDGVIVVLVALGAEVPYAITLCAFVVGMTVINHDLVSGAVVSIFPKPMSRSSYTAGKLMAAVSLLLLIAAIFTGGILAVVSAKGGSDYAVPRWTPAALPPTIDS